MSETVQGAEQGSVPTRQFYLLFAATIMFSTGDDEQGLGSVPINCLVRSNNAHIGLHELTRAQRNCQVGFLHKLGEEAAQLVTIRDVVITSIVTLGYMTEDEFQAMPATSAAPSDDMPIPNVFG